MKATLLEAIKDRPLLGDGAMGTQLMAAGLEQGGCGDAWNLSRPEDVLAIQRRYVEAGSDCLITNTFGGCRISLARHGQADNAAAINEAAARIARKAFGDRDGYVIGDIGPFGGFMEPYGEVPESDVREAFNEQAKALVAGGVDAVIVETQTALEELAIGVEAARSAGAACVIGSMAYDVSPDGAGMRTMMGIDPEAAARFMDKLGVDVVALNCGTGMDMAHALQVVKRYRAVTGKPVMVQPNAGQPKLEGSKLIYDESPERMAAGVKPLIDAGANVIGACCGSTPEHIRAFRKEIDRVVGVGA